MKSRIHTDAPVHTHVPPPATTIASIYHEAWTPLPNNTWTEIGHLVYPTELDGMWVWRTRGSGVWANVGNTIVFPTPSDPNQIHADAIAFLSDGCSKTPSKLWPQLESDVFGFCAREKGYGARGFGTTPAYCPRCPL